MLSRRVVLARWASGCAAIATLGLSGCASQLKTKAEATGHSSWSGRLVLRVSETPKPKQFAANFELLGNAQQGELLLTTPLGITVAALNWSPEAAWLRHDGKVERYECVEAMTLDTTGAAFPLPALFAWLQGRPEVAQGWQPDLTLQKSDGMIVARRAASGTTPAAELKLVLDPP